MGTRDFTSVGTPQADRETFSGREWFKKRDRDLLRKSVGTYQERTDRVSLGPVIFEIIRDAVQSLVRDGMFGLHTITYHLIIIFMIIDND
jgi:hypothetical protein